MANIDKELNDIKNAVYGKEVRGSIHDGIKKINEESEEAKQKSEEAHHITQDLLDESFDSAALEANFEQRLDNEISNLQPEWTQFKDQTTQQLVETEHQLQELGYNVKNAGAVGDGITDDTDALEYAFSNYSDIYMVGVFRITRPILVDVSKDFNIRGNAVIFIDTSLMYDSMIQLNCTTGVNITTRGIEYDGRKSVSKAFSVINNKQSMVKSNLSNIYAYDSRFVNVKKYAEFTGDGAGLFVRGAFGEVVVDGFNIEECELPAGQGTSGSQGVTGVTLTHFGENAFVRKSVFKNGEVEKVYSSDSSYNVDQDGIKHLTPINADSTTIVDNVAFTDCFTRSLKTQTGRTVIGTVEVNNIDSRSNGYLDAQYGNLTVDTIVGNYLHGTNGNGGLIGYGSHPNLNKKPHGRINNLEVNLFNDSTLSHVISTFPREGLLGYFVINNVSIYGKIDSLVLYRVNGPNNNLFLNNTFVEDFTSTNGKLVRVFSSGFESPYRANITVENAIFGGAGSPDIIEDRVPGSVAIANLSARGNIGFSEDRQVMSSPPITTPDFLSKYGNEVITLEPGEEHTFNFSVYSGAMVTIVCDIHARTYAQFYAHRHGIEVITEGSWTTVLENEPLDENRLKVWKEGSRIIAKNDHTASCKISAFYVSNIV